MATSNERLKILKMVQERKISAEEGIELLDLISEKNPKGNNPNTDSDNQPRASCPVVSGRCHRYTVRQNSC